MEYLVTGQSQKYFQKTNSSYLFLTLRLQDKVDELTKSGNKLESERDQLSAKATDLTEKVEVLEKKAEQVAKDKKEAEERLAGFEKEAKELKVLKSQAFFFISYSFMTQYFLGLGS